MAMLLHWSRPPRLTIVLAAQIERIGKAAGAGWLEACAAKATGGKCAVLMPENNRRIIDTGAHTEAQVSVTRGIDRCFRAGHIDILKPDLRITMRRDTREPPVDQGPTVNKAGTSEFTAGMIAPC